MNDQVQVAGPEADKLRDREISRWFAQGHDLLDEYGIPRFGEYTLPQRIAMLGEQGGLHRKARTMTQIMEAKESSTDRSAREMSK